MSHTYKKLLVDGDTAAASSGSSSGGSGECNRSSQVSDSTAVAFRSAWRTRTTLLDAAAPYHYNLCLGLKGLGALIGADDAKVADALVGATPLLKFNGSFIGETGRRLTAASLAGQRSTFARLVRHALRPRDEPSGEPTDEPAVEPADKSGAKPGTSGAALGAVIDGGHEGSGDGGGRGGGLRMTWKALIETALRPRIVS